MRGNFRHCFQIAILWLGVALLSDRSVHAADAPQKVRIVHASRSNAATPQFFGAAQRFL